MYAGHLREKNKQAKFGDLARRGGGTFEPFVLETYGAMAPGALRLLRWITGNLESEDRFDGRSLY